MEEQTKRCPFCDEIIRLQAIKCKHCGSMITDSASLPAHTDTVVRDALSARYEVLEVLGRGGMGMVYKAIQKNLNRPVALKILLQQFTHDDEFLKRFHREARKAAQLNHPNIVVIYDEGVENNVHYIAMEYIDGEDLRKIIVNENRLSVDKMLGYIAPVANALGYAHRRGIVHRDIKSANILLNKDGQPKLTDFGIARITGGEAAMTRTPEEATQLTRAGVILGTLQYMSPEQVQGQPTDGRSDIYSLGVVMYHCLTGELPFRGDTDWSTMHKITNETPTAPRTVRNDIPKSLEKLVLRCMAKDPNQRYSTCEELHEALLRVTKEPTTSRTKLPKTPPAIDDETVYGLPAEAAPEQATTVSQKSPFYFAWKKAAMLAAVVMVIAIAVWKSLSPGAPDMGDDWERLSDLDKKQIELHLQRAERLEQAGKLFAPPDTNALEQYRKILEIHPQNKTADKRVSSLRSGLLEQAAALEEKGNYVEAKKLVQIGLEGFQDNAEFQAANRKLEVLQLVEDAKNYATRQQYISPLGQNAYDASKKIIELDPQNQTALAIMKEIETWFLVEGNKLAQQGKLRQAGEHYTMGRGLFPENATLATEAAKLQQYLVTNTKIKNLLEAGKTHLQNKNWKEAWGKGLEALKDAPNDKQARDFQGQVLSAIMNEAENLTQRKRYKQALEAYGLVKELNPAQKPDSSEAVIYERIGDDHLERRDWDDAAKSYRTALRLDPEESRLRKKLDNAEAEKKKWLNLDFVFVQGGEFKMGNTLDGGDDDERPAHAVKLQDFYMSRHEITFAQYEEFCRESNRPAPPDNGWGRDNRPVINVSWTDAKEFCAWLSRRTGAAIRLPTEAEWEYAARDRGESIKWAGTSSETELEQYAWTYSNSNRQTQPVGQKKANRLGFYDMSGNAWEWCSDGYDEKFYRTSLPANPQAEAKKKFVRRGGSVANAVADLRAANRSFNENKPKTWDFPTGFRVVRGL